MRNKQVQGLFTRMIRKPVAHCVTGFLLCLGYSGVLAESIVLAPGYHSLKFDAPMAGSYSLPVIDNAGDGDVLDMQGQPARLHDLLEGKYVLLSFIYTQCGDVNGCPLATFVTSRVKNKLLEDALLGEKVRFISLSFDPNNDTPKVMQRYGNGFNGDGFDWQFISTASEAKLEPILQKYRQSILKEENEAGEETGVISHILRVFLIDPQKQIRNIYSTSFLHPDTIINDIKTLEMESSPGQTSLALAEKKSTVLHGAGDVKDGYESDQYTTNNQSLVARTGKPIDLLKNFRQPPLGLPKLKLSGSSRLSKAKVQLGRRLFYDRRLSHNNTFSCAMCHVPEQGFTSNEIATAVGIEGRTVRRNAPTLYNVAYAELLFHDARENSLEQQIWSPLLAHNEMGNPSVGRVIDKILAIPEYVDLFKKAFRGQAPDMKNIGEALASYQRTLVSANSAFDRWYFAKESEALSAQAQAGHGLFVGKAGCVTCHSIGADDALFTDNTIHNTGIGYQNSMAPEAKTRRVLVAPGTWLTVDADAIADSSEARPNDLGRYEITEDPADRWKYKTPGLRNVALSAPYMHDGSLTTLEAVIDFYNVGGVRNELLDPLIKPLGLNADEKAQLVAFLEALTGDNVDDLISDAFAAPVGNTD